MSLWGWLLGLFRRKPPPAPPPPPVPGPGWRHELLTLVNQRRALASSPLLVLTGALNLAAQEQSRRMAAAGRLFHGPTDEVVGQGQRTPREIVDGWMGSPGHRARLLDPRYRQVGFGRALGYDGLLYWTGDFA